MLLRMKKRISKHLNRQNLIEAAAVLKDVDYCVFYGTALGIHRDGDLIDGDDDVDTTWLQRHASDVKFDLKGEMGVPWRYARRTRCWFDEHVEYADDFWFMQFLARFL